MMPVTINGSAGVTTNSGAVYDSLQRGTAVTASGTSVDFTSIPSWVRRITVMFNGVSTNGTGIIQVQLGDAGGIEITGYTAATASMGTSAFAATSYTTGFGIRTSNTAADTYQGSVVITNISGNVWVANGCMFATTNYFVAPFGGTKTLSDPLTQLRVIGSATGSPADTFDAGTINIIYE